MPTEPNTSTTANLFWTGGWDSTCRLLHLLLKERKSVQPYYVIDPGRKSTGKEIERMLLIRKKITALHPSTDELFNPTIYKNKELIAPSAEITNAWKNALKQIHIGTQYEYLARYCKELQLSNIELCVKNDLHPNLRNYVLKVIDKLNRKNNLPDKQNNKLFKKLEKIFKYFHYPLINSSKLEQQEIAEKNNWMSILQDTWFCHAPKSKSVPCGKCTPCSIALEHGHGWRIPLSSKIDRKKLHFKIYLKEKLTSFPN